MNMNDKIKAFAAKKAVTDKLFRQKTIVQSTRFLDKDGLPCLDVVLNTSLPAMIDSNNWQVVAVETEVPESVQSIFSEQTAQKGRPKKEA